MKASYIGLELQRHAPFTLVGTASGIVVMLVFMLGDVTVEWSQRLFWIAHPVHIILSALVTTAMYRKHSSRKIIPTIIIGYLGSVGIASLSDSIIPYIGEWMLQLPNKGIHLGCIEKWWLVNPLAFLGIAIAWFWPQTRFPHAGHVLISTWASLFHMMMALTETPRMFSVILIAAFLFLAVWLPCCTSDIVFPLLFAHEKS